MCIHKITNKTDIWFNDIYSVFADGFCTAVTARSLMCNYAIPDYPICTTYCNEGHVSIEGTLV